MVPLIYSSHYNITAFGIERLHPFDGAKYQRIHDWLIAQGIRRPADFTAPEICSGRDLLRVHTPEYLEKLNHSAELAKVFEFGLLAYLPHQFTDWRVLSPMRWATGGTILAARLARERGFAINIGGGYHHASAAHGHGFCVYADEPIALATLHAEKPFRSALVVDADVHQGDGTADAIRSWPWARMFDLYEQAIFPSRKAAEDYPVPLPSGLCGAEYLRVLQTELPKALDRFQPEFVMCNAGSDVLESDPLSSFQLTIDEMIDRDLFVVTQVRERGIPLVMALSGGYSPQSWAAHARSIEALVTRFDRAHLAAELAPRGASPAAK